MGVVANSPGDYNVYLSISKQASKEHIDKALEYLKHFNATIFTYDGENYDQADLLGMDAIIFLTGDMDSPNHQPDGSLDYTVGKGQFTEAEYFYNNVDENEMYVISDLDHGIHVDELKHWRPKDSGQGWQQWGYFETYGQCIELVNYSFFSAESPYYHHKESSLTDSETSPDDNRLHLALLNAKHLL